MQPHSAPWGLVDITGFRAHSGPVDAAIAMVAARQRGLITTPQLTHLGLSGDGIRIRARGGRLHRQHRGVYAVGHPALDALGRLAAAVLACGPAP